MRFVCGKCSVEQDESEFYRNRKCKYGINRSECKTCRKLYKAAKKDYNAAYMRQWYLHNRDAKHAYNSTYYKENRERENERARKWRNANKSTAKFWSRRKYERSKGSEAFLLRRREYAKKYRLDPNRFWRISARVAVRAAVMKGLIKKLPCEVCGDPKVQGHHHKGYSYEHWLDVQWLCRVHHCEAHGQESWTKPLKE